MMRSYFAAAKGPMLSCTFGGVLNGAHPEDPISGAKPMLTITNN